VAPGVSLKNNEIILTTNISQVSNLFDPCKLAKNNVWADNICYNSIIGPFDLTTYNFVNWTDTTYYTFACYINGVAMMVSNVEKVNYQAPCNTPPDSFALDPTITFPLKKFVGTYGQFSLTPSKTFTCELDLDSFDDGFTSGFCENEEDQIDINDEFIHSFLTSFKSDYSLNDTLTGKFVNISVTTAIDDVTLRFNITVAIDQADLLGQGYYSSFKNTPQQLATTFINIMNYFSIAAGIIVGFSIKGFLKKMLGDAKAEAKSEANDAVGL